MTLEEPQPSRRARARPGVPPGHCEDSPDFLGADAIGFAVAHEHDVAPADAEGAKHPVKALRRRAVGERRDFRRPPKTGQLPLGAQTALVGTDAPAVEPAQQLVHAGKGSAEVVSYASTYASTDTPSRAHSSSSVLPNRT